MTYKLWTGVAAACLVAACGGGGGEDVMPTAPSGTGGTVSSTPGSTAQGLRTSTVGTTTVTNLNRDDDQFWTFYRVQGIGYIGFSQGSQTVSGNQLNGTGKDYMAGASSVGEMSVTATFTPQGSSTGSMTSTSTGTVPFTLAYDARYDQAAVQSAVVGSWNLSVGGQITTVTVASDGAVSGSNVACTLTGSMVPRAGGKNVFDTSVTFAGGNCPLTGQVFSGIALATQNAGSTELLVGLTNAARTTGILVAGSR